MIDVRSTEIGVERSEEQSIMTQCYFCDGTALVLSPPHPIMATEGKGEGYQGICLFVWVFFVCSLVCFRPRVFMSSRLSCTPVLRYMPFNSGGPPFRTLIMLLL